MNVWVVLAQGIKAGSGAGSTYPSERQQPANPLPFELWYRREAGLASASGAVTSAAT